MDKPINNTDGELKKFMRSCWDNYQSTRDITHLVEAVEAAPFFGEAKLVKEIVRILRGILFFDKVTISFKTLTIIFWM